RRLRHAAVPRRGEVRERHRLAELHRAGAGRGRDHDRPGLRHGPHRGALRDLRQPSRPCLPRRPAPDRPALLHQRRGADLHAGLSPAMADDAGAVEFWFDFTSPYAYFASLEVEDVAARHGRTVQWRPFLLGAVFRTTGMQALTAMPL